MLRSQTLCESVCDACVLSALSLSPAYCSDTGASDARARGSNLFRIWAPPHVWNARYSAYSTSSKTATSNGPAVNPAPFSPLLAHLPVDEYQSNDDGVALRHCADAQSPLASALEVGLLVLVRRRPLRLVRVMAVQGQG